jgi:hypothetical protein
MTIHLSKKILVALPLLVGALAAAVWAGAALGSSNTDPSGLAVCASNSGALTAVPAGATTCNKNQTEYQLVTSDTVASLASQVTVLTGEVSTLQGNVSALQTLLKGVTRTTFNGKDTLQFSGMNVQIVNGTGQTSSTTPDGLGNLIVGYDEGATITSGQHDIIVGTHDNFSSFGGIDAGLLNTTSGPYSSVTGGYGNTASGQSSSVSGGDTNVASGGMASASGGGGGTASGNESSVSGGVGSTASGLASSVSGGEGDTASGQASSILGGNGVTDITVTGTGQVSALQTLLSGVKRTTFNGNDTLLFTGMNLQVVNGTGFTDGTPNGLGNLILGYNSGPAADKSGSHDLVIGDNNTYTNTSGIVSGFDNTLSGSYALANGALNTASGNESFAIGAGNTASGFGSFVSGQGNTASGQTSFVGGGFSGVTAGTGTCAYILTTLFGSC